MPQNMPFMFCYMYFNFFLSVMRGLQITDKGYCEMDSCETYNE